MHDDDDGYFKNGQDYLNNFRSKFSYKECHEGSLHVFTHKGIQFWGGGSTRGMSLEGMDVIIDCADVAEPKIIINGPLQNHFQKMKTSTILKIDWPDMGIPAMTKKEWVNLVKTLEKIKKEVFKDKVMDVLCCCVGGHGRTGTSLSIIAGLTILEKKKQCPVTYVRTNYCKKAVESEEQSEYITKITGKKVKADVGWSYTPSAGATLIDEENDLDVTELDAYYSRSKEHKENPSNSN